MLAGLLLGVALAVTGAAAANKSVSLTATGPKPALVTIVSGQQVVFVNNDTVPHEVRSQGAWQFDSGPLPPGRSSSPTPKLTAPGTYTYSDLRGIVVLPQTFTGRIVVPRPKPNPTPTPKSSRSPAASPRPSPTLAPSSPTASPSPAPVVTPPCCKNPVPSPTNNVTAAPTPTASPTPIPDIRYGDPRALAQHSPHRFGLPVLIGIVAAGGVLSLLVRYLLSLPEGQRTRDR